jgi:hypothetical protein
MYDPFTAEVFVEIMGGRTLLVLEGEFWSRKTMVKLHKATMVNRPPPSFIYGYGRPHSERPPRRDAIHIISGLSGLVWWWRGGRGRLGG